MKTYITIVDPAGATVGYGGPPAPISHRVLLEGKVYYGFESSTKLFDSPVDQMQFLNRVSQQPSGTTGSHGNLEWSVVKQ
jgi:hypothetical protein